VKGTRLTRLERALQQTKRATPKRIAKIIKHEGNDWTEEDKALIKEAESNPDFLLLRINVISPKTGNNNGTTRN
jgi:hypothetical protein